MFIKWHIAQTDRIQKKYKLSNYTMYWLSWGKGVTFGLAIGYFIF